MIRERGAYRSQLIINIIFSSLTHQHRLVSSKMRYLEQQGRRRTQLEKIEQRTNNDNIAQLVKVSNEDQNLKRSLRLSNKVPALLNVLLQFRQACIDELLLFGRELTDGEDLLNTIRL